MSLPTHLTKYWHQRYSLFSKFDDGIQLDEESWYSVTPEAIARHIAQRCRSKCVVDAFCGSGGNAIQFAMTCDNVIAIDIDLEKLENAKKNAEIYNVLDKIQFIHGNAFELLPQLLADVVFLSPPWGGIHYNQSSVYDLEHFQYHELFALAQQCAPNIVYYVPRHSNLNQLKSLASHEMPCEIQETYLNGSLKCLTVYYGQIAH